MEKNLFELSTRRKYRYTYKGWISVEELWDMSLQELDTIYKNLNKQAKSESEESLMDKNNVDEDLMNRIEIVKYIFNVKQTEAEEKKAKLDNAEKKRKILDILAEKKDESLRNASEEELMKMLDEME